jgi:hypothetical protein
MSLLAILPILQFVDPTILDRTLAIWFFDNLTYNHGIPSKALATKTNTTSFARLSR